MGNFEDSIPKNIGLLEKELGSKRREIWSIEAKYEHSCNCEYCTEDEMEDIPAEDQRLLDSLEAEVNDYLITINRLKRYAEFHGVEIPKK